MKTIILPGMGATSKMYPKKIYSHLHGVVFAEWPRYGGESSLGAVAEKLIIQHSITKEMIVGGSSLGGMVAIEIAKRIGNRKVLLIGSATSPSYINPLLFQMNEFLDITPVKLFQTLTGKVNQIVHNEIFEMFEGAETDFMRAMCKALFKWNGVGSYSGEIQRIHGDQDFVIFPPPGNVQIIQQGGHLIAMTHGPEVASFIEKHITH